MINRSTRNRKGSAVFELAAGSLISISVVAFVLNVCFAMLSYGINDHACRDAARAAAQGATSIEANKLASAIVKSYNSNNGMLAPITVTNVVYNDFGGNPAPDLSPFVTVTTQSKATMPAPIDVFGSHVFSSTIPVTKTYTFPIVRLTVKT